MDLDLLSLLRISSNHIVESFKIKTLFESDHIKRSYNLLNIKQSDDNTQLLFQIQIQPF